MQYIDLSRANVVAARESHYRIMRFFIKKKINGKAFKENPPIPGIGRVCRVKDIERSIGDFLNNEENLRKVLIGTPEELDEIKDKFSTGASKINLKKLLKYSTWVKKDSTYKVYNAYHLAEKLDIPTCVYCNRMYTKTVITSKGRKLTRPTFDHWFPQSQYPLLALSFYNLIPSCTICNSSMKGPATMELKTHFHPYHQDPELEFRYRFSYDYSNYDTFNFKIRTDNKFSERSVKSLELEEVYKTHKGEIEDMRKIRDAYSEGYISMLENQVLGSGISLDREEVYRLAFGVHYEEAKFHRRPLSKMKKDILTELGVIV